MATRRAGRAAAQAWRPPAAGARCPHVQLPEAPALHQLHWPLPPLARSPARPTACPSTARPAPATGRVDAAWGVWSEAKGLDMRDLPEAVMKASGWALGACWERAPGCRWGARPRGCRCGTYPRPS